MAWADSARAPYPPVSRADGPPRRTSERLPPFLTHPPPLAMRLAGASQVLCVRMYTCTCLCVSSVSGPTLFTQDLSRAGGWVPALPPSAPRAPSRCSWRALGGSGPREWEAPAGHYPRAPAWKTGGCTQLGGWCPGSVCLSCLGSAGHCCRSSLTWGRALRPAPGEGGVASLHHQLLLRDKGSLDSQPEWTGLLDTALPSGAGRGLWGVPPKASISSRGGGCRRGCSRL